MVSGMGGVFEGREVGVVEGHFAVAVVHLYGLVEVIAGGGEIAELGFVTGHVVVEDAGLAEDGGPGEEDLFGLLGALEFVQAEGVVEERGGLVGVAVAEAAGEFEGAFPVAAADEDGGADGVGFREVDFLRRERVELGQGLVGHVEVHVAEGGVQTLFELHAVNVAIPPCLPTAKARVSESGDQGTGGGGQMPLALAWGSGIFPS